MGKLTQHRMFQVAAEWCEKHPKWKRICDIENSDSLTLGWAELPKRIRQPYERYNDPESHWREFATKPYRHRYGFVGENGEFYPEITQLPLGVNCVMVFEVGGRPGTFYRGGQSVKSGVIG